MTPAIIALILTAATTKPFTTGPLTLYVGPGGADKNSCLIKSKPCASPQEAINHIPKGIRDPVVVELLGYGDGGQLLPDGGTFTYYADNAADAGARATVEIDGFTVDQSLNTNAGLTIDGATNELLSSVTASAFTSVVDAGPAICLPDGGSSGCGYVTSPPRITAALPDGGAFTLSAFKGAMVEVTGGTAVGNTYPIVDNDTSTITLPPVFTTLDNTSVFHIITPAVKIQDSTAAAPTVAAVPTAVLLMTNDSVLAGRGRASTGFGAGITIKHCAFKGSATGGFTAIALGTVAGVTFRYNQIDAKSNDFSVTNVNDVMAIENSSNSASAVFYTATYFDDEFTYPQLSGSFTATMNALNLSGGGMASVGGGLFTSDRNAIAVGTTSKNVFATFTTRNGVAAVNSELDYISGTPSSTNAVANGSGSHVTFITASGDQVLGFPVALLNSGDRLYFNVGTSTNNAKYVSLDNGSTWTAKADIEAGTNKTVFNTSTGALAKEQ